MEILDEKTENTLLAVKNSKIYRFASKSKTNNSCHEDTKKTIKDFLITISKQNQLAKALAKYAYKNDVRNKRFILSCNVCKILQTYRNFLLNYVICSKGNELKFREEFLNYSYENLHNNTKKNIEIFKERLIAHFLKRWVAKRPNFFDDWKKIKFFADESFQTLQTKGKIDFPPILNTDENITMFMNKFRYVVNHPPNENFRDCLKDKISSTDVLNNFNSSLVLDMIFMRASKRLEKEYNKIEKKFAKNDFSKFIEEVKSTFCNERKECKLLLIKDFLTENSETVFNIVTHNFYDDVSLSIKFLLSGKETEQNHVIIQSTTYDWIPYKKFLKSLEGQNIKLLFVICNPNVKFSIDLEEMKRNFSGNIVLISSNKINGVDNICL
jgi:hypothetical protein